MSYRTRTHIPHQYAYMHTNIQDSCPNLQYSTKHKLTPLTIRFACACVLVSLRMWPHGLCMCVCACVLVHACVRVHVCLCMLVQHVQVPSCVPSLHAPCLEMPKHLRLHKGPNIYCTEPNCFASWNREQDIACHTSVVQTDCTTNNKRQTCLTRVLQVYRTTNKCWHVDTRRQGSCHLGHTQD